MLIPRTIGAIAAVAAKEPTRYAMTGVRFTRVDGERVRAEATDGRRVIRAEWTDGAEQHEQYPCGDRFGARIDPSGKEGFSAIVPWPDVKGFSKLAPKRSTKSILTNVVLEETTANGAVRLVGTDLERVNRAEPRLIEGEFPAVDAVLPKVTEATHVSVLIDAFMLAETLKALAETIGLKKGDAFVRVSVSRKDPCDNPVILEAEGNGITALGAQMPVSGT